MEAPLGKCWHCKEKPSFPQAVCDICLLASYCSDKCRERDLFRHKLECFNAVNVSKCNRCGTRKSDLKACTGCYSAFYCNKECQLKSWKSHKHECESNAEKIFKIAADRYQLPPYSELPSYIGSSIAENYLRLGQNEGADTDLALKLLFLGVGDIRDVVRSIAEVPSKFRGKLAFVLDDISTHIMARNLLFLYISIVYPKSTEDLVQIWYSVLITQPVKEFLTSVLKDLASQRRVTLLARMHQLVKISEEHWQLCVSIWQGWLRVDVEEIKAGLRFKAERAVRMMQYTAKCINLFVTVPRRHKSSFQAFMNLGVLLPVSLQKKQLVWFSNPTMAHFSPFNAANTAKYHDINSVMPFVSGWGYEYAEDSEMIYGVRGDCYPFVCWDYLEVRKMVGTKDDLIQMYQSYLNNVFDKFTRNVKRGNITFQLIIDGFDKVPQYLTENDRFDRISLSSLSDHYTIPSLLKQFSPLLNRDNRLAVIISKHVNWHKFTYLKKEVKFTACVSEISTAVYDTLARPNVLPDAATICTIPEAFAAHILQSYINTYPYFLKSLLAEVVLYLHKTFGIPLSKPAMKKVLRFEAAFGLTMRDYRRELNRIVPFYRESLTRRLSFTPNAARYLEWKAT